MNSIQKKGFTNALSVLRNLTALCALGIFAACFMFSHAPKPTLSPTTPNQLVRIARLDIDSAQLEAYKAALKEEIEASVRLESGVLALNAVADKKKPTQITILEIYADTNAYRAHLETPHFKKYKTGTKSMVKALELVDVVPVAMASK